jgi:hypothetical protein
LITLLICVALRKAPAGRGNTGRGSLGWELVRLPRGALPWVVGYLSHMGAGAPTEWGYVVGLSAAESQRLYPGGASSFMLRAFRRVSAGTT